MPSQEGNGVPGVVAIAVVEGQDDEGPVPGGPDEPLGHGIEADHVEPPRDQRAQHRVEEIRRDREQAVGGVSPLGGRIDMMEGEDQTAPLRDALQPTVGPGSHDGAKPRIEQAVTKLGRGHGRHRSGGVAGMTFRS